MPLLNATTQPESVVSCLEEPSGSGMGRTLELFWNTSFTLMIVTALIGNSAVLWIVISTSYVLHTTRLIIILHRPVTIEIDTQKLSIYKSGFNKEKAPL